MEERLNRSPRPSGDEGPSAAEGSPAAVAPREEAPERGSGRGGGGRPRRRFRRGKVCQFCVAKAAYIDYKDLERLRSYLTDRGKILPRRISGNCSRHQRMLTVALKRARVIALIPAKVR